MRVASHNGASFQPAEVSTVRRTTIVGPPHETGVAGSGSGGRQPVHHYADSGVSQAREGVMVAPGVYVPETSGRAEAEPNTPRHRRKRHRRSRQARRGLDRTGQLRQAPRSELRPPPQEARGPELVPLGPPVAPIDPKLVDSLTDEQLLDAIRHLAAPRRMLDYGPARRAMFGKVDNERGHVRCVYTSRELTTTNIPKADGPGGMNTEHTWPKSQGVKNTCAISDLHHLYPTDTDANSKRASYPFGVVVKVHWEKGGSKLGLDARGQTVFEPRDDHKGNVARSMFYVSNLYGLRIPYEEEVALKAWNHADPVDDPERARNDAIARWQGNRNPYVDDENIADRVADF